MALIPPLSALGYLLFVKSTLQRAHVSAFVSESCSEDSWEGGQKHAKYRGRFPPEFVGSDQHMPVPTCRMQMQHDLIEGQACSGGGCPKQYICCCRYQPSELIVTENGFSVKGEYQKPLAQLVNDTERVAFYRGYINAATEAVEQDQACCCLPSHVI